MKARLIDVVELASILDEVIKTNRLALATIEREQGHDVLKSYHAGIIDGMKYIQLQLRQQPQLMKEGD